MLWIALILGLIEGLTEFLPISSTGHLHVASELIGFTGPRADLFKIFIQLGAILAVVFEFRVRLWRLVRSFFGESGSRRFPLQIALAFVPFAVLGLLFKDQIFEHLFSTASVAWALIVGALGILLVEARRRPGTTKDLSALGWRQAVGVGLFQCLALWPGFSRSAATILGGLLVHLDRRTATEFSFFLAIPVMFGATGYSLWSEYEALVPGDVRWLLLATVLSFLVAWLSIRWLLGFVSQHSFAPFAWYRLALGVAILIWMPLD